MIKVKALPIGRTNLSVKLEDIEDIAVSSPVNGSIPVWANNKLQISSAVTRQAIIGGGTF